MLAVKKGRCRVESLHSLILAGADINESDNKEDTPLHVACWNGYKEIVTALLAAKVLYGGV